MNPLHMAVVFTTPPSRNRAESREYESTMCIHNRRSAGNNFLCLDYSRKRGTGCLYRMPSIYRWRAGCTRPAVERFDPSAKWHCLRPVSRGKPCCRSREYQTAFFAAVRGQKVAVDVEIPWFHRQAFRQGNVRHVRPVPQRIRRPVCKKHYGQGVPCRQGRSFLRYLP